jgi:hypothetical protein
LAVCQKGREKTYSKYFRTRQEGGMVQDSINGFNKSKGCVDEVILVDKFGDIVNPDVQEKLRSMNTIFIHNRYFWVYCDFNKIEKDFRVDTIINLINKTNNLATDIDDSVDSRSRVKNQQRQQRNIATLYKLLIDAGVALDKKQLSTDSDWGGDAWRARDW